MNDLWAFFAVIIFLVIFFAVITVIGHLIWLAIGWGLRGIFGKRETKSESTDSKWEKCITCGELVRIEYEKCFRCGTPKPSGQTKELKKELEAAWRQTHNLHRKGSIDSETFNAMRIALEAERDRLLGKTIPKPEMHPVPKAEPTPITTQVETWKETVTAQTTIELVPTFKPEEEKPTDVVESVEPVIVQEKVTTTHVWASSETSEEKPKGPPPRPQPIPPQLPPPVPQQPSRSWAEVVEAFMEQSNIRWGEIIGGLIIIGSSTALVISLWATIAQNPFLKFLVFTFATVFFFGIGLYTEHRWKLPTTSRGILTIATLLVPLNFLAVAAVSGEKSLGLLMFASEVFAPALYFVLVYFAGKTLTPRFPQVLAVGVLGSSIGQILIRHFATPDMEQGRVLSLGIFTTLCFAGSLVWMLFKTNEDEKIDEGTANSIFITLGTSVFAAILPLGLLLFKSASFADTLMWISPLIGFCGAPLLACGLFLWKKITDKELAYSRLAGTSVAIIGAFVVFASMLLAFPNPTSVVLTALVNFVVFTLIALIFSLPIAHVIALFAFTLAYTVGFQIVTGRLDWQLPRNESLFPFIVSPQSGQLFAPLFLLYLVVSELLRVRAKKNDSTSYFIGSIVVVAISMGLLAYYGFALSGDLYFLTPIFAIYAAGIFAYAWTRKLSILTWFASFIFLLSLTQGFGFWYGALFAWQTAMLVYATLGTIAAILFWQIGGEQKRIFADQLRWAALIASSFAIIALIQSSPWQTTAMITGKLFWISLIWFGLLWLINSRWLRLSATTPSCRLTCKDRSNTGSISSFIQQRNT